MKTSVRINHRIYYLIVLDDDRWYFPKHRWWYHTSEKEGSHGNTQTAKTWKKVLKVLRRLQHENYKGKVTVTRREKYIPEKGNLFTEYLYNLK
jgi:hypothetical protein